MVKWYYQNLSTRVGELLMHVGWIIDRPLPYQKLILLVMILNTLQKTWWNFYAVEIIISVFLQQSGGMAGISKTTFAQKIFNNHRMMSRFDTRIWLCITQEFSEMEFLKQIARDLGVSTDADNTKAELVQLVATVASSRSLFIVLDDVWQPDIWNDLLRNPIQSTNACGRILYHH